MELSGSLADGMTDVPKNLVDSVARKPVADSHQAEEFVSQEDVVN